MRGYPIYIIRIYVILRDIEGNTLYTPFGDVQDANEMRTVEDAIRSVTNLEFINRAEAEVNSLRLVAVINIILAVNEVIQFEE